MSSSDFGRGLSLMQRVPATRPHSFRNGTRKSPGTWWRTLHSNTQSNSLVECSVRPLQAAVSMSSPLRYRCAMSIETTRSTGNRIFYRLSDYAGSPPTSRTRLCSGCQMSGRGFGTERLDRVHDAIGIRRFSAREATNYFIKGYHVGFRASHSVALCSVGLPAMA